VTLASSVMTNFTLLLLYSSLLVVLWAFIKSRISPFIEVCPCFWFETGRWWQSDCPHQILLDMDVISQGSLEKSAEENKKIPFSPSVLTWEAERDCKESSCFRNCSAFRTTCASVDSMMDVLQPTCLKYTISMQQQ